jgi:hypothetical protein
MQKIKEVVFTVIVALFLCWAIDAVTGLSKWDPNESKPNKQENGLRIEAMFLDNGVPSPFTGTIK